MTQTPTTPQQADPEAVRRLFNPAGSIAIIGATDKSAWTPAVYGNLTNLGFAGPVHLVNPRRDTLLGRPTVARIDDLPDDVDLAYIQVPPAAVPQVVGELGERGVRSAVVLTAGFGELGEDGREREREIKDLALSHGMMLLGPNGVGFVNATAATAPFGIEVAPPLLAGGAGFIVQSGALTHAVNAFAQSRAIGVSLLVSSGNELMISATDVIRYLVEDDATKAIGLFLESIRDPQEFLGLADQALAAGKPIVALKVGRSETSARAAKAHTGALVGDDAVVDAAFRQHGVVRVDSIEDLVVTTGMLSEHAASAPRTFAFLSTSGGICGIIADRAEDEGVAITEFSPETKAGLSELLPPFASPDNPVDVSGLAASDDALLAKAMAVIDSDPGIDAIVMTYGLPGAERDDPEALDDFRFVGEAARSVGTPLIVTGEALLDVTEYDRNVIEATGYPQVFGGVDHSLTAVGGMARWSEAYRSRAAAAPVAVSPQPIELPDDLAPSWSESRAAAFLAEHGVPVVSAAVVTDAEAAVAAAEKAGYPVVLKVVGEGIEHKTDIGGVKLDLTDADAVREAYAAVVAAGKTVSDTVEGALVQPQLGGGVELLVAVIADPTWGQVLTVGLGGVWVEVLRDTVQRILPVDRDGVRKAIEELRGAPLLKGARGSEPADMDQLVDVVADVGTLAQRLGPRLESLEINPLFVKGSQIAALDALITWRTS